MHEVQMTYLRLNIWNLLCENFNNSLGELSWGRGFKKERFEGILDLSVTCLKFVVIHCLDAFLMLFGTINAAV